METWHPAKTAGPSTTATPSLRMTLAKGGLDVLKQRLADAGFKKLVVKNALRISGANAPRLINKVFNLR